MARDAGTNEVTEAGQADVFNLQVGDCFNDTDLTSDISEVPAVPCADPHDNEIYYLFDIPGSDCPGEDAVNTAADEGCIAGFEAFVGLSYDLSALDYGTLTPSQDTWESMGDREVVCSLYDPAGQITGSLAGSAR